MEWKPIESAPKDGASVLLLIDGDAIQGAWCEEVDAKSGYRYGPGSWEVVAMPSHGCGCCAALDNPPTHWMHLPTPPETNDG